MIYIPDQYEALYALNPNTQHVLMPERDVQAVDYLVRISRGHLRTVETAAEWEIIAKIFEFWTRRWPYEWKEFTESMEAIKQTRRNASGLSKSREIRYVGALPPRFERLIKACFPLQQFNREFVHKLVDNIKVTKVGEYQQYWFTIPDAPQTRTDKVEEAVKQLKKPVKKKKIKAHGNTKQNTKRSRT